MRRKGRHRQKERPMAHATLSIADSPTPDGHVWSDGWVVDPRDDVFYALSLIGSPTAVRSLQAAIAERANLRLTHQRTTRDLKPHVVSRYQRRSGRLPPRADNADAAIEQAQKKSYAHWDTAWAPIEAEQE